MENKDVFHGLGFGYEIDGRICMIRCFSCGKENYSMAVSSGCCAFCNYDANTDLEKEKPKTVKS